MLGRNKQQLRGATYNTGIKIRFKSKMLKLRLCDSNEANCFVNFNVTIIVQLVDENADQTNRSSK